MWKHYGWWWMVYNLCLFMWITYRCRNEFEEKECFVYQCVCISNECVSDASFSVLLFIFLSCTFCESNCLLSFQKLLGFVAKWFWKRHTTFKTTENVYTVYLYLCGALHSFKLKMYTMCFYSLHLLCLAMYVAQNSSK